MIDIDWFLNVCLLSYIHKRIYVGYSGGMDSSVLLHLFSRASKILHYQIKAIHVNHTYSNNSRAWSFFCKKQCDELNIPITIYHVTPKYKNIEEYFRIKRFECFSNLVLKNSTLALAHHQGDFLETLILNIFRGSGSTGLNSIKKKSKIKNLNTIRPLIKIKKIYVKKYIDKYKINYITDFSNFKMFSNRNYLRYIVFPIISKTWYNFEKKIYNCVSVYNKTYDIIYNKYIYFLKSKGYSNNILLITYLISLPLFWRYEVLKLWIDSNNYKTPSTAQLIEINKLLLSKNNKDSYIKLFKYEIRKYKNYLYIKKITVRNKYKKNIYIKNNFYKLKYKKNIEYRNYIKIHTLNLYKKYINIFYHKQALILLPGYWITKDLYRTFRYIYIYRSFY